MFVPDDEDLDAPLEDLEDLEDLVEWDDLIDKAEVCVYGGIQPSEYDRLTDAERAAFIHVINQANKQ